MRLKLSCLIVLLGLSTSCKKMTPKASKPNDAAIIVQGGDGFLFYRDGDNIGIRKCPMYQAFFEKDGTAKAPDVLKAECNISESAVPIADFRKHLGQALKLASHFLNPTDKAAADRYKIADGGVEIDILRQQKADLEVELKPIWAFLDSLAGAGLTDVESNLSVDQLTKKKELESKLKDIELRMGYGVDTQASVAEINTRIDGLVDDIILSPGLTKQSIFIFSRDGQGFVYNILNSYVQNVNILGLGLNFVPVPAGSFMMGSPAGETGRGDDELEHKVNLTNRFEIMTTEVTQKTWFEIMGDNPSRFRTKESCAANTYFVVNGVSICPYNPVENVSWERVQEFIRRINESSPGAKYRLPTEAEWEYVARGGRTTPYISGNDAKELPLYVWFGDNAELKTNAIASKSAHTIQDGHKTYDLIGNVWEWTEDYYGSYPANEITNPKGPDQGDQRVIRGCAWSANAPNCRFANRERESQQTASSVIGFRLVREMK